MGGVIFVIPITLTIAWKKFLDRRIICQSHLYDHVCGYIVIRDVLTNSPFLLAFVLHFTLKYKFRIYLL